MWASLRWPHRIRRIEAVSGRRAEDALRKQQNQIQEFVQLFGTSADELPERIEELLGRIKDLNKSLERSRLKNFNSTVDKMIAGSEEISDVKIIAEEVKSADMKLLRLMADLIRQKAPLSIVVLASVWERKVIMICALSQDLRARGLDAIKIIRRVAEDIGGAGGGRVDFAQAGGTKIQGLNKALMKVGKIVREELKQ